MTNEYQLIMRHIFEVRLKNRNFSFLDFKGKMIDFVVKETGGENIRYTNNGARIDIASKDLSEVFFFSLTNFGFQIEGAENFDVFKEKIDQIFSLLETFNDYSFDSVSRIGTKSTIFCHKRGKNFETVKQQYKNMMFKDYEVIEKNIKAKIFDLGYVFNEIEKNGGKIHVTTGPVTKEEVVEKFFGDNVKYMQFHPKDGIFYEIDFSRNEDGDISLKDLKALSLSNIENLNEVFEGFITYFFNEK